MPTVTISYGYDIHSVVLTEAELARVRAGEKVEVEGQGFVHETDGGVRDFWVFNREPGEEAMFWLDNGAEFFAQDLRVQSMGARSLCPKVTPTRPSKSGWQRWSPINALMSGVVAGTRNMEWS